MNDKVCHILVATKFVTFWCLQNLSHFGGYKVCHILGGDKICHMFGGDEACHILGGDKVSHVLGGEKFVTFRRRQS